MVNPPLSIVLPTYNRPEFLPRMLDSVISQTFDEFELLLINNGSMDQTTDELCKTYVQKDQRIRYFKFTENQGPAPARNLGIKESRGKYLIHLDDDDYCEPDHLRLLFELIVENDADVAISGCVDEVQGEVRAKYEYDGVYVWNKSQAVSEFLKREKFHTAPATKLYRKSLFDHVSYRPGMIIDDIHVTYRLFAHVNKAVAHGIPTYRFRKFGGNTTSFLDKDIVWQELLDEYFLMQEERVNYISKYVPEERNHVRYASWSYMISMVEKIQMGRGENCEKQYRYMVSQLRDNKKEFLNAPWITERELRLMKEYVMLAESESL